VLYGAAALLETFYTATKKAMQRAIACFDGVPDGPGWQRSCFHCVSTGLDLRVQPWIHLG
jgi:hypothetical protein